MSMGNAQTNEHKIISEVARKWGNPEAWNGPRPEYVQRQHKWGALESWNHPWEQNGNSIQEIQVRGNYYTMTREGQAWGNPGFAGSWPHPDQLRKAQPQLPGFPAKKQRNHSWGETANYAASPRPQQPDLKGQQYFDYLKMHEIDDEALCLLSTQGIHSLYLLRQCSQESLVVVGIKLVQVLKLKRL